MNFIGRVKNYLLKENKVDFIHKNDIGKINKGALQIMNALEKADMKPTWWAAQSEIFS